MVDRRDPPAPTEATPESTAQTHCRQWYHAHGQAIYSYLRFHLSSPDEAENLTADVFLRALRRFDRFDPSIGSPLKCEAPSPEERVLWEEQVGRLLTAMAELSSNDRQIITLCYGAELPVTEAGELLGLNATAARTRLWRALGRLRKVLVQ